MAQYTPQYLDYMQLNNRVCHDEERDLDTRLFIGQGHTVGDQGHIKPPPPVPFLQTTNLGDTPLVAFPQQQVLPFFFLLT